eukprot:scaffold101144_cov63-Phaeocystis_antarctica.AAC.1
MLERRGCISLAGQSVTSNYGGCRRGTQSFEDQLGRADAGSWQIADSYVCRSGRRFSRSLRRRA